MPTSPTIHFPPEDDTDAATMGDEMSDSPTIQMELKKVKSPLVEGEFTERLDRRLMERLIKSDLLHAKKSNDSGSKIYGCSEKAHLVKLMRKVRGGELKVKYAKPSMGFGRVHAKGGLSVFCLRRALRHTLCEGNYIDLDIVNCHPVLLAQLCRAHSLQRAAIDYYVHHRDACLAKVSAMFKEGTPDLRDKAKRVFLSVLYGGQTKPTAACFTAEEMDGTTMGDYLVENPVFPPCVVNLRAEAMGASRILQRSNAVLLKKVQKDDKPNLDGRFLSFYMQELERRAIEAAVERLISLGSIDAMEQNCVLCHDGLMVEAEPSEAKHLAEQCAEAVHAKLGLRVAFEAKPMGESLLPRLEEVEAETKAFAFPAEKLMKLDYDYVKRELATYEAKKAYLEHFLTKVRDPQGFVLTTTRDGRDEHGQVVRKFHSARYCAQELKTAISDVGSGEYNRNGDEIPFATKWLTDMSHRTHCYEAFEPYNGVYDPSSRSSERFNLFMGFNPAIKTPLPEDTAAFREKTLRGFFRLGLTLFEGNQSFFDFFLKCVACKIQHPRRKLPICFILTGQQGCGKNVFLDCLGRVVGSAHFISSTEPNDFFGTHAEGFVRKLFVVMNECEGKDTFMYEGKIKGAVSDLHLVVNAKHVRPYEIENLAMIIIATNKTNPIPIDVKTKDRRYCGAKATDEFAGHGGWFWKNVVKSFSEPTFVRCLYDHLNGLDPSTTDFATERKRNLTKSYYAMASLYAPIEAKFFEDVVQSIKRNDSNEEGEREEHGELCDELKQQKCGGVFGWNAEAVVKKKQLYDAYMNWGRERNLFQKLKPTATKFYGYLGENGLKLPILSKKTNNGIDCFVFYPKTVYEHVQQWTCPCDEGETKADAETKQSVEEIVRGVIDACIDTAVSRSEMSQLMGWNSFFFV